MRKFLIAITLVATGYLPALAGGDDVATISVNGTATTDVVPDELVWNLQVRNEGASLPEVVDTHTGRVARVLVFIDGMGVGEDDMSPSRMSCGENWVRRGGSRTREGYHATTNITFRSHDLDAYVKFWAGLAEIEGLSIQSVGYDHTDRIVYQNETRRAALRAARDKAVDLAAVLDATIGEPLQINESPGIRPMGVPGLSNVAMRADGNAGAAAATPGRITIRMSINAVFRLVPGEGK